MNVKMKIQEDKNYEQYSLAKETIIEHGKRIESINNGDFENVFNIIMEEVSCLPFSTYIHDMLTFIQWQFPFTLEDFKNIVSSLLSFMTVKDLFNKDSDIDVDFVRIKNTEFVPLMYNSNYFTVHLGRDNKGNDVLIIMSLNGHPEMKDIECFELDLDEFKKFLLAESKMLIKFSKDYIVSLNKGN